MGIIIRVKGTDIVLQVVKTKNGYSVRVKDGNPDFLRKFKKNTVVGRGKTRREATRNANSTIKQDVIKLSPKILTRTKQLHQKQLITLKKRKNVFIAESTKQLPHPARIGSTFAVKWVTENDRILEEERVSFSPRTRKKVTDLTPLEIRRLMAQATEGAVAQIIQQFQSARTDSIIAVKQTGPVVYRYLQDKRTGQYIKERVYEFEPSRLPIDKQTRDVTKERMREKGKFDPKTTRAMKRQREFRKQRRKKDNQ